MRNVFRRRRTQRAMSLLLHRRPCINAFPIAMMSRPPAVFLVGASKSESPGSLSLPLALVRSAPCAFRPALPMAAPRSPTVRKPAACAPTRCRRGRPLSSSISSSSEDPDDRLSDSGVSASDDDELESKPPISCFQALEAAANAGRAAVTLSFPDLRGGAASCDMRDEEIPVPWRDLLSLCNGRRGGNMGGAGSA